jgi:hypothetical protein
MGQPYSAGDGYSTALFGFGEGLSYTEFDLTRVVVSPASATLPASGTFKLAVTANNTGGMAGK